MNLQATIASYFGDWLEAHEPDCWQPQSTTSPHYGFVSARMHDFHIELILQLHAAWIDLEVNGNWAQEPTQLYEYADPSFPANIEAVLIHLMKQHPPFNPNTK